MASDLLPDPLTRSYAGRVCLVTGGLGFIGSNLVLELTRLGATVRVIDSLEARHGGDVRNVRGADPYIIVDNIANAANYADQLIEADYVFNLAGQVSHTDSMEDPVGDLDINARSQLAFLEALHRVGASPTLVYASTRQVYGRPEYLPVDELHPVHPVDVNGVSKLAAERFHHLYCETYGLPVSVLRLSNVYGPLQRLEGDHQGFLPVFVRHVLQGEPIVLFGDGSQERDCLYVDDAVRAILAAGLTHDAVGETFNIGHPDYRSLQQIADTLIDIAEAGTKTNVPWPHGEERISIGSYRTDISKAEETLGWSPEVGLREGLKRTITHYRARYGPAALSARA